MAVKNLTAMKPLPKRDMFSRSALGATIEIANKGIGLEPRGSPKWTMAGKIRNRRQITTLNI